MTEIESLRAEVAALRKEIGQLRDRLFFDSARPVALAAYPHFLVQPLPMPVYPFQPTMWPGGPGIVTCGPAAGVSGVN
jgi:hypothetical protein